MGDQPWIIWDLATAAAYGPGPTTEATIVPRPPAAAIAGPGQSTAAVASPHTGQTKCSAGGPVMAAMDSPGGWSRTMCGCLNWSPQTNHRLESEPSWGQRSCISAWKSPAGMCRSIYATNLYEVYRYKVLTSFSPRRAVSSSTLPQCTVGHFSLARCIIYRVDRRSFKAVSGSTWAGTRPATRTNSLALSRPDVRPRKKATA